MTEPKSKPAPEDLVARGQKKFQDRLARAKAERVTGSVTLEVYLSDGVPNGRPKVVVSEGA